MSNAFVISDTHFGHWGVTKFLRSDGTKLRPWDNIYDMDEALVQNWNSVVTQQDTVYHLGDVLINRRAFSILNRLKGRKILIKGNHDIFHLKDYLPYFVDIRAYNVKGEIIMSHIPLHESQLERWKLNVHGHLHSNYVMKDGEKDKRYFNACVEVNGFKPISFDDIQKLKDN